MAKTQQFLTQVMGYRPDLKGIKTHRTEVEKEKYDAGKHSTAAEVADRQRAMEVPIGVKERRRGGESGSGLRFVKLGQKPPCVVVDDAGSREKEEEV